jgi:uncharacterized protein (DUF1684 family)
LIVVSAGLWAAGSVGVSAQKADAQGGAGGQAAATPPAPTPETTEEWRAKREIDLKAPDGWLSLAGLFFLNAGANSIGTDPASRVLLPPGSSVPEAGTLTYDAGHVWLEISDGIDARINGTPIRGRVELHEADAAKKVTADRVTLGRLIFHLQRSGDRLGIRLRDPQSPYLTGFAGLRWYPIDSSWRIIGRFVPYARPRELRILNIAGDLDPFLSPGEVTFVAAGSLLRLEAIQSGDRLWFVFRDETASRGETYRIRFLYADAPAKDGTVILDFNRAYNPPCSYNPHTTCPIPPPQNRLKIAIPAGERTYLGTVTPRTEDQSLPDSAVRR